MIDQDLWTRIEQYPLDNSWSEYGFSTRLANEHYWTKNFTSKAILEYKRFMYLAATSDMMVSPSPVVDEVWHQHLIFTQSYQEFCQIAGKAIQHIPSTHNTEDAEKFKQAKERTTRLYHTVFGEQPADIWGHAGMYESLNLEKAPINIRTVVIWGLLILVALIVPAYHLLQPLYVQIGNPDFPIGYAFISFSLFAILEYYNRQYLSDVVAAITPASFLADLHPLELVYMGSKKLSDVVNGVVNRLIDERCVQVHSDYSLHKMNSPASASASAEEHQVLHQLDKETGTFYPGLLSVLITRPIFQNTLRCIDAFEKYFVKSKKFGRLFYINFGMLSLLALFGIVRLFTGLLRDKPVEIISIELIVLTLAGIFFLRRLTGLVCTVTVPGFYRHELTKRPDGPWLDWQWKYFILGSSVLVTSFVPLVEHVEKGDSGGSSSSSCGSSCGSSCSSCGGCGGD
jgi:hypothetical protein